MLPYRNTWPLLALSCVVAACSASEIAAVPKSPPTSAEWTSVPDDRAHWKLIASAEDFGADAFSTSSFALREHQVYVAAAPDFGVGRLARFDLRTDRWESIPTSNWPIGKFRRIVFDPTHHEVVTYWDGLGEVYSVPEDGGAWTKVGNDANSDSYYEGGAFWDPVAHRVATFGGYGFGTWHNTLWEFDRSSSSWTLTQTSTNAPWPRIAPSVALDEKGGRLFVTSGEGSPSGNQSDPQERRLNDLWQLDLATHTWVNLIALSDGEAPYGVSLAYVRPLDALFRFGGVNSSNVHLDGLEIADRSATPLSFRTVEVSGPRPSARRAAALYYDRHRHRLVLFGGYDGNRYVPEVWSLELRLSRDVIQP